MKFGFFRRNLFLLQNVFVFEDVSPLGTDEVGDFDDVDVVDVVVDAGVDRDDVVEAWNVRKLIRPPSKPLLFESFFAYIDVNGEVLEILVAMVGLVVHLAACTTCGRYRSPR